MSSTEENISAVSVTADTATFGNINSHSIVNKNAITTDTLTANGSAQIGGNLNVNGSVQVMGTVIAKGGISLNDVAMVREEGDFLVKGVLTCMKGANFGHETIITSQYFGDVLEGVISANNIRATNRLIVGDSPFEINSAERRVKGDTFSAYFRNVIADRVNAARSQIQSLNVTEKAEISNADIATASVNIMTANEIQVQSFTATAQFFTRGLTVDGSATVTGGVTINGAGMKEGALVVSGYPAVFNNGIKVYSKEGALVQTLNIIGTVDTTGHDNAETNEDLYAFNTAIGVRAKFQGDVDICDSDLTVDNGAILAEKIVLQPISVVEQDCSTLTLLKSGDGWDKHVDKNVAYPEADTDVSDEDDIHVDTVEEVEQRAAEPWVGHAVDITSERNALALARERKAKLLSTRKARAYSIAQMARAFQIKATAPEYRIDAGGNILAKNAVIQNVRTSKATIHEVVADTIRTNNFEMANVAVVGRVQTQEGLTISGGSSELKGHIVDYSTTTHRADSSHEFREQATATFHKGSTLKIADGGALITDDDAAVSLHGEIEIDLAKLVLYNSINGRRYQLILRDAVDEEGDEPGDIAMQFNEIKDADEEGEEGSENATPVTVAGTTRAKAQLNDDLVEFQARLKRI